MRKIQHGRLTEEALGLIAARFRVLAEPMRLKLLHTLGRDEMNVGELVEKTGGGQANVSKHLSLLTDAGIVRRRKQGLSVYYRVADDTIFELCELVCASVDQQLASRRSAIKKYPAA
jgi:ArsR family transcriptional regulator